MSFYKSTDFGIKNVSRDEATFVDMTDYKKLEKRIVELEEVLKDARGVCHKAGLELMRDDIDEVLKGR